MIRLKKKKAEERAAALAKAKADAAAAESGAVAAAGDGAADDSSAMDVAAEGKAEDGADGAAGGGMKLLGIGGRSAKRSEGGQAKGRRTPGEIRIQKDIAELDGGSVATVTFPNPNDLTSFHVEIRPDEGMWQGAAYDFTFSIDQNYPHQPPRVLCNTPIYHPNINFEGNVCLNILREDWKPVFDINCIIYGLIHIFQEPNADDPLNHAAAEMLRNDPRTFERLVKRSLRGATIEGMRFPVLVH